LFEKWVNRNLCYVRINNFLRNVIITLPGTIDVRKEIIAPNLMLVLLELQWPS